MDNKQEARKKAEALVLEMAYEDSPSWIDSHKEKFSVYSTTPSSRHIQRNDFPFVDIKEGEVCVVRWHVGLSHSTAIYHNGSFYSDWEKGFHECHKLNNKTVFVRKTGFNILEHLEAKQ